MKKWNEIEGIKAGDIVLRPNGLYAKPSQIEVLSIRISGTMAYMTWRWSKDSVNYFSTDFRKSINLIDYGLWHDLTTQMWSL